MDPMVCPGTVSFTHYDRLKSVIDNITTVRHGNIYAEVAGRWEETVILSVVSHESDRSVFDCGDAFFLF